MIKITLPRELSLAGGKYNSNVHDWRIVGSYSEADNGTVTIKGKEEHINLTLEQMLEIVKNGGTVEYVLTFMLLKTSKLDDEIPEGLPDRTYKDEQGVINIRTWRTWRDNTHPITRYNKENTEAIFRLNSFGYDIPIADVKIIVDLNDPDITILLKDEYKALMNTPDWKPDS